MNWVREFIVHNITEFNKFRIFDKSLAIVAAKNA